MQQYRVLSLCPTPGNYNAIYFDADDRDRDGNPSMFYLRVAAFGVVDTTSRKGIAGPLVPHGEAGLVPAWLLEGFLECAPEEETELGNEEHEACWLERWREEHPNDEDQKKTKKRSAKKKVRKTEPEQETEKEEEEEEEAEEEEEDDDDDDDPPQAEVHMGGRRR